MLEFWPYGLKRADGFASFKAALAGYGGYYDLAHPQAKRPLDILDALYDRIGEDGDFTDILVLGDMA